MNSIYLQGSSDKLTMGFINNKTAPIDPENKPSVCKNNRRRQQMRIHSKQHQNKNKVKTYILRSLF